MKAVRWALVLAAAFACLLVSSRPLFAHHGVGEYQMDQVSTINGTVVDYQLINPHTQITIRVSAEGADPIEWKVESVASNMMVRVGWKRDSLKPGDVVTVTGHPGKNGKPVMLLLKMRLPEGRELDAPYE
jgi:hypothetical protein